MIELKNHEGYMDITAYKALKNIEKESKAMSNEKLFRGDIFTTIKADQTEGSLCVIISNDEINEKSACVLVLYLNDLEKKKNTDVIINAKGQKVAECSRIYTLHKSRIDEFVRTCTDLEIEELEGAILSSLGIRTYELNPDGVFNFPIADQNRKELESLKEQVENLKEINRELESKFTEEVAKKEYLQQLIYDQENPSDENIVLRTERDLYKRMYEEILEKVVK